MMRRLASRLSRTRQRATAPSSWSPTEFWRIRSRDRIFHGEGRSLHGVTDLRALVHLKAPPRMMSMSAFVATDGTLAGCIERGIDVVARTRKSSKQPRRLKIKSRCGRNVQPRHKCRGAQCEAEFGRKLRAATPWERNGKFARHKGCLVTGHRDESKGVSIRNQVACKVRNPFSLRGLWWHRPEGPRA